MSVTPTITPEGQAALDFLILRGEFRRSGSTVEDVTRPNVDGNAFRRRARKTGSAPFISIRDAADESGVAALRAAYAAAIGRTCEILDGRGRTWSDIVVQDVEIIEVRPITGMVGGLESEPEYIVTAQWALHPTEA